MRLSQGLIFERKSDVVEETFELNIDHGRRAHELENLDTKPGGKLHDLVE